MVSALTWLRYISHKLAYSMEATVKYYDLGQIRQGEMVDVIWKNLLQGKMTFLHWNKGVEMVPTIGSQGGTLLVRKMPIPNTTRVFVGDVVVLKDPENSENLLVRRLAAVEGYEMASKDEKEESFILQKNECWVLSDNQALKPKEAKDSRTFGPVHMSNIIGRVMYCLRSAVDHGPVQNSERSMWKDSPVLEAELDVDEMARNQKS